MYNRAFPVGNALFLFSGSVMSLFRLPRSKFSLAFLAVPAGKDAPKNKVPNRTAFLVPVWLGAFVQTYGCSLLFVLPEFFLTANRTVIAQNINARQIPVAFICEGRNRKS